jgi:two-component Ni(II)/redox sensor kinase NrsS
MAAVVVIHQQHSLLVMGAILFGAGFVMAHLLLQEREAALRRELQTVAGTLHDSLKPSLPSVAVPSASLAAVLPGLCLVGQPCPVPNALIERHAISAADPARFQLQIFDARGQLLAASPGAQGPARPEPVWQEQRLPGGERLLSYAIHLHRAHGSGEQDWGTLQISRSLTPLDSEASRLWWLGHGVFALAMAGMALASWWLAGLAMAPLLEAYRRQEQFSADVAHELRTPLANLLALLEAERSGLSRSITPFQAGVRTPAPPKAEAPSTSGLDRMLSQGRRLQRLIADLLLLASLERPAHRRHLQQCNLAEICADVLEDFSEAAAAATVTLEAAIDVCPATMKLAGALHRHASYQPRVVASRTEIGCRGNEPPLASGRRLPCVPRQPHWQSEGQKRMSLDTDHPGGRSRAADPQTALRQLPPLDP